MSQLFLMISKKNVHMNVARDVFLALEGRRSLTFLTTGENDSEGGSELTPPHRADVLRFAGS